MRTRSLLAAVGVLCVGCGSAATATTSTSRQGPTVGPTKAAATPTPDACAVVKQAPLPGTLPADFATALAFTPDGRLFIAQRGGTVKVFQNGAMHTFADVRTVTTERDGSYSERGLLGLAVSPNFATDHFVYAFYSDPNYADEHVVRWSDCAGVSSNQKVLLTLPAGPDCCHKGGRLAFGPDGKLYVTLGDEHTESSAQNTQDIRGKVLRYNPDGTVPADTPFGTSDPTWAYGFRNPFGLAISSNGQIGVTGNGPSGDAGSPGTGYDLLVLSVTRGAHYQWPLCYGYSHPLQGSCSSAQAPDWSSENSTWVPTGSAFVDATGPAPFAGHFVFCSYDKGMGIVTPGSPHATVAGGPSECRFAVVEGGDHAVYYSDSGTIYRVAP